MEELDEPLQNVEEPWGRCYRPLGVDGVVAELLKDGGRELQNKLPHVILRFWDAELILEDFIDANIIKLYREKETSMIAEIITRYQFIGDSRKAVVQNF